MQEDLSKEAAWRMHFYLEEDCDVDELIEKTKEINSKLIDNFAHMLHGTEQVNSDDESPSNKAWWKRNIL